MISKLYKNAYIDETGNFGYDFKSKGNSQYFILTAVIISPENLPQIEEKLRLVQSEYFGGEEIKSSSIGNDYVKRIKILKDISTLDFNVIAYVVDKEKIDLNRNPGLGFKPTFIKVTHKYFHKELTGMFDSLNVFSDKHGTEEFMAGFIEYFNRQELYLLSKYDFQFVDSKECIFVQLADFISGTIAYKYEDRPHKDKYRVFLNFLDRKILKHEIWPIDYKDYFKDINFLESNEFNESIANHCLRLASNFASKEHYDDELQKDRILIVQFLMFKLRYDSPEKYYTSKEIRDHIFRVNGRKYSFRQFQTNLISKLRDNGVIISTSSHGYKIPISVKEIYSYTNHTIANIGPMLERLRKVRNEIRILTNNELDILDSPEYQEYKEFFDHIKKDKI